MAESRIPDPGFYPGTVFETTQFLMNHMTNDQLVKALLDTDDYEMIDVIRHELRKREEK